MQTTVQRWGNSLAVRIPKAFASQADLAENTRVRIALEEGSIVIRPAAREWKLDDLVKGITAANRHRETDWGKPVGKEVW